MDYIGIAAVVVVVLLIVFFTLSAVFGSIGTDNATIVSGSYPGFKQYTERAVLPDALNQPEGRVYSYSGWILVKDFTVGYGRKRRILSKGDAPGIYLDSTSNSLLFAIKTYGATETILVPNIPAMKWVHFALVVDQQSVEIYINGTLRQHHTLGQLPDLVDAPLIMGPGWDGVLARVKYYAYALKPAEIKALAFDTPPDDLIRKPAAPQYFDISWYIGRLNSM
jgi:hypothetical protein